MSISVTRRGFLNVALGAGASSVAFLGSASPLLAIPVTCTNCASLAQQIIDYGIRVKAYATQVLDYATQVNMYITAVRNTMRLPFQVLGAINNLYYRVTSLARRATAVLTSDAGIMSRIGMASSLISSAGRFPNSTIRNVEWWKDRTLERWDDNRELLGMNDEAQLVIQDAASIAAEAGANANGNLEAAQAQSAQLAVTSQQIAMLHNQLQRDFAYQVEKDMDDELKKAEYRKFIEGLTSVRQSAWSR